MKGKKGFLSGLGAVIILAGCGGGGSGGSTKTVDINDLSIGYKIEYTEGVNSDEGEITFCANEYNVTGIVTGSGTFVINGTLIEFTDNLNAANDFDVETDGAIPEELTEYEWYEVIGVPNIEQVQVTSISDINCT